jgi:hypothetical protein
MSTVLDILKAAQELPELQRKELIDQLIALKPQITEKLPAPYVVKPLPLGLRRDKLPSHILEEIETQEFIQSTAHGSS